MPPFRPTVSRHTPRRLIVGLAGAILIGASMAVVTPAGPTGVAAASGCQLNSANGAIKHVIYVQFDNVHFLRDNPNVPSDVEQMPNLLNFIKSNGTLLTNDHTILISHTGGGILSSLTGLYPDRHGQAVSNSYNYFRADGTSGFSSTFKYWTDNTDGGNPANNPPTVSADTNFNMVNADPASLGGTGATRNAPAPWVPFTRAGCDVGNVGVANTVLENNSAIVFRSPATTLAAASAVGDTNVKVTSVAGLSAGQSVVLETGTASSELAVIASVGTAGSGGTGVTLTAPLVKAHAGNGAFTVVATDPTGDMTKVFGEGSPEWTEGRASQIAQSGTPARALAQTDFVGIAVHCAAGGGICSGNTGARPDPLPDEAGGYAGFSGLFGAKYVNPAINGGSASVDDTSGSPIVDPFGQPGFPGFDGMYAKNTLGEVAQMQEAGIPVTYAYISDAHDFHGVSGNTHVAYGPGEAGYVQQLKDYDAAFGSFFTRLASDGINKNNTLFVFTVEEGDHFAGTAPDGPCDGVTTPCTYANGHVTEVNGDLKKLVATYNAGHGTSATTSFSVHSDMAPNVYVNGNPARDSATARDLEKAMSDMQVTNPLSGVNQHLFVAMADPVEEQLLHMVTADPARTPTFTPFAEGDYFLNASSTTPCLNGASQPDLSSCVFLPNTTPPNQTFAWNHGGVQPEVRTTWVGIIGPGVNKSQPGNALWSDHTDLRPTILRLVGLKDDYVTDGRVMTEFLANNVLPQSLKAHGPTLEKLGAAYKQIMASFGQFSMDTLVASTGALASNSQGDTVYSQTEAALIGLGTQRDALAAKMRLALWAAEFGNTAINEQQAKGWISQADDLLSQAAALAGRFSSSSANVNQLDKINHIVVIYEENHSFDNLFGGWEGVNGLADADPAHTTQVDQAGVPYTCLKQLDANLTSPPLAVTCTDAAHGITSAFPNAPFTIDDHIPPSAITCPPTLSAFSFPNGILDPGINPATGLPIPGALPGGCTRDLIHEFYQDQYQENGGRQNRYMTGSDSTGTTMGVYDTTALPVYKYLHSKGAPDYAISDDFFQSAFGGSFLNHQWLIAAASPVFPGATAGQHTLIDSNGMPVSYPLYTATGPVSRQAVTVACGAGGVPPAPAAVCGNWAVNTMQPPYFPSGTFGPVISPQTGATIGDRLSDAGIDWAWYAGGWSNANGDVGAAGWTNGSAPAATTTGCLDPNVDPNSRAGVPASLWPRCPNNLFQYHHQPFNYYAAFSTGTPAGMANRAAHLKDEAEFSQLAASSTNKVCDLKPVSFVKPIGQENEHPGYASEPNGNDHLVALLQSIEASACAKDTMIIVTYDEFGGQWDHVPAPGQGNDTGPHDVWGPGTRIPTLTLAPHMKGDFVVDGAEHDTTSILATIEHRFGLDPLGTRDAAVNDMSTVFDAKKVKH